jgi:hypothetical protein
MKPMLAYRAAVIHNFSLESLWKHTESFARKIMSTKNPGRLKRSFNEQQLLAGLREVFIYPEQAIYTIAARTGVGRTALTKWSLKFERKYSEFRNIRTRHHRKPKRGKTMTEKTNPTFPSPIELEANPAPINNRKSWNECTDTEKVERTTKNNNSQQQHVLENLGFSDVEEFEAFYEKQNYYQDQLGKRLESNLAQLFWLATAEQTRLIDKYKLYCDDFILDFTWFSGDQEERTKHEIENGNLHKWTKDRSTTFDLKLQLFCAKIKETTMCLMKNLLTVESVCKTIQDMLHQEEKPLSQDASSLLVQCRSRGYFVSVTADNNLSIDSPVGYVEEDFINKMKTHKQEIITEILKNRTKI